MFKKLVVIIGLFVFHYSVGQTTILDEKTNKPVSYATISFGNGNGIFADDEGKFLFTEKMYSDIDSLYISALGYKELKVATKNLPKTLLLPVDVDELQEVIIQNKPKGKYKVKTIKPILHDDYFNCWLPTVESEIAVFFPNKEQKTQKIDYVYLPVKAEASQWKDRKKSKAKKRPFSTIFRVKFYENKDGYPRDVVTYDELVFIVNETNEEVYELNITENDIYIPKTGIFVSVQVMGYADRKGKLIPNKKYKEVKTRKGIVKVSTTFRPLLPFTNKMGGERTFVKRIFLFGNKWVKYNKTNIKNSKLLSSGMNNYGIGLKTKVYLND